MLPKKINNAISYLLKKFYTYLSNGYTVLHHQQQVRVYLQNKLFTCLLRDSLLTQDAHVNSTKSVIYVR